MRISFCNQSCLEPFNSAIGQIVDGENPMTSNNLTISWWRHNSQVPLLSKADISSCIACRQPRWDSASSAFLGIEIEEGAKENCRRAGLRWSKEINEAIEYWRMFILLYGNGKMQIWCRWWRYWIAFWGRRWWWRKCWDLISWMSSIHLQKVPLSRSAQKKEKNEKGEERCTSREDDRRRDGAESYLKNPRLWYHVKSNKKRKGEREIGCVKKMIVLYLMLQETLYID